MPILQQLVNSRGQDFVDVIDEWLSRRSEKPRKKTIPCWSELAPICLFERTSRRNLEFLDSYGMILTLDNVKLDFTSLN